MFRKMKNSFKSRFSSAIFALVLAFLSIIAPVVARTAPVFADEIPQEIVQLEEKTEEELQKEAEEAAKKAEEEARKQEEREAAERESKENSCRKQVGGNSWLICNGTEFVSNTTDALYGLIKDILLLEPASMEENAPTYMIWKYFRSITNILFIIFLIVIIFSQVTGIGITNYGIKKALPKLIIAAVLVNLSYLICAIAIDVSNIVGQSLRGVFESIQQATLVDGIDVASEVSFGGLVASIIGGSALTIGAVIIAIKSGAIYMLLISALAALAAVASGLITIALRQAVVMLLVMVAPIAIVCNILPNTESLFKKWTNLFKQMLVFYPLYSLLFGASNLAGWAMIASAKDSFMVILGLAVQAFPLFYSWKLMSLSNTILGTVNEKIRSIGNKPIASATNWAQMRGAERRARSLAYGRDPYSRLQRYLDNRRALHEDTANSLTQIRKNDANRYVQKKITGGYDGTKATEANKGNLRANRYTRIAKDLSNSNMAAKTASLDTSHVLDNYGGYYVHGNIERGRAKKENMRAEIGATNYLELNRAEMTAQNDEEADFNFMVGKYLTANANMDPNNKEKWDKYRHYIVSSAGGLGEIGTTAVMGRILAKAAAVESRQRRDMAIVAAKYPPDKRSFRNMIVGYYNNDDGFATDKEGNSLGEKYRGEFLANSPEKLVMWDKFDEAGAYYDWYDTNGAFVARIHKKDKPTIKELMCNCDMPINDPINNLYGILSGIKEDPTNKLTGHIGLDDYRTTISRGILAAQFKEKNACVGPMVGNMMACGYIQNYAQQNLAYLDSFNKATKPGTFNTQDHDAVKMMCEMMDPDKWEETFPTEMIRGFRNVNGEQIYGIRKNADGTITKVPAEEATREELMERVKQKFIAPAATKMMMYMSRQTQNTMDNQKGSVAEDWKNLKKIFDTKYGTSKISTNPYEQVGDTREMANEIRSNLYVVENGKKRFLYPNKKNGGNNRNTQHGFTGSPSQHVDAIEELARDAVGNVETFVDLFDDYCMSQPGLSRAYGMLNAGDYTDIEDAIADALSLIDDNYLD